MFTKRTDPDLQTAIDEMYKGMAGLSEDSPEYAQMLEQLVKLYSLKEVNSKTQISADTLAVILANLGGILLILSYERTHVVASKAIGFIMKLR